MPAAGKYAQILEWCCEAVHRGIALFPISDTIYIEISKILNHRQRRDLRKAIERVSRFFVITSRVSSPTHEVEALLDDLAGPNPRPINDMNCLDWDVSKAFGRAGGVRIRNQDGEDLTAEMRSSRPDGPTRSTRSSPTPR